jgi:hypothetical protein
MWAAPKLAMPVKEATESGWATGWVTAVSSPRAGVVCVRLVLSRHRQMYPSGGPPVPLPSQVNLSDLVRHHLQLLSNTQCGSTS